MLNWLRCAILKEIQKIIKKQNSNTLLNIPPYNNIILFFDDTPDKIFQKRKEGKLLAPCY
jgi:hypothetical protein